MSAQIASAPAKPGTTTFNSIEIPADLVNPLF
jgi:hypothetical protein